MPKIALIEFATVPNAHSNEVQAFIEQTMPENWEVVQFNANDYGSATPNINTRLVNLYNSLSSDYKVAVIPYQGQSANQWRESHISAYANGLLLSLPHYLNQFIEADPNNVGFQKYHWMLQVGAGSAFQNKNTRSYGNQLEFWDAVGFQSFSCGTVAGMLATCLEQGMTRDEARQAVREQCSLYPERTLIDGYGRTGTGFEEPNDVPEPLGIVRTGVCKKTVDIEGDFVLQLRQIAHGYKLYKGETLLSEGVYSEMSYQPIDLQDPNVDVSLYNLDGLTKTLVLDAEETGTEEFIFVNVDSEGNESLPMTFSVEFVSEPVPPPEPVEPEPEELAIDFAKRTANLLTAFAPVASGIIEWQHRYSNTEFENAGTGTELNLEVDPSRVSIIRARNVIDEEASDWSELSYIASDRKPQPIPLGAL